MCHKLIQISLNSLGIASVLSICLKINKRLKTLPFSGLLGQEKIKMSIRSITIT